MEVVRREVAFTDAEQSLLSYARVLEENYGVRFVDGRIKNMVEDVMSSYFLAANSRAG